MTPLVAITIGAVAGVVLVAAVSVVVFTIVDDIDTLASF